MDIITVEKFDHLYWLGRYTERVYTLLKSYLQGFDKMIDKDEEFYKTLCQQIGIPNTYVSKADFIKCFPFDETNPVSLISNLNRAYDNAIVMRDYIGTDTMSYIQLAIDDVKTAEQSPVALTEMQKVIDHILAFWGCVNDQICNMTVRNIIKLGKGIERLDLYLSLERPIYEIQREFNRMESFLIKSQARYDCSVINTFNTMFSSNEFNYSHGRNLLRNLILE